VPRICLTAISRRPYQFCRSPQFSGQHQNAAPVLGDDILLAVI